MTLRIEERYWVEKSRIEEFLNGISSITSPKVFPKSYNRTLYFNNSEHEIPFGLSVKARRYDVSAWDNMFDLDPEEEWIFEIKKETLSEDMLLKQKERERFKLREILETVHDGMGIVDFSLTHPLRPYVADSYNRRHYIVGDEEFRITVDDDLSYYFFESGLSAERIGGEDYCRVEVKLPQDKSNSTEFNKIKGLLRDLGAEIIISKKDMAYGMLGKHLREMSGRNVPSSDTEIEAKLSLDQRDQYVFHQIKNDFYRGTIPGFEVSSIFPYTLESGQIHGFIASGDNKYERITMAGRTKKLTLKENLEIVDDPFDLGCIIKRKEIKKEVSSILSPFLSKTFYRRRKYFIAENRKNENSYCILIDKCTSDGNELVQMEIEGLLLSPSTEEEKEVVDDVAFIADWAVKRYGCLKPTTLTKFDWLRSL